MASPQGTEERGQSNLSLATEGRDQRSLNQATEGRGQRYLKNSKRHQRRRASRAKKSTACAADGGGGEPEKEKPDKGSPHKRKGPTNQGPTCKRSVLLPQRKGGGTNSETSINFTSTTASQQHEGSAPSARRSEEPEEFPGGAQRSRREPPDPPERGFAELLERLSKTLICFKTVTRMIRRSRAEQHTRAHPEYWANFFHGRPVFRSTFYNAIHLWRTAADGYKIAANFGLHPPLMLRQWNGKLREVSYFGDALRIQTANGQFLVLGKPRAEPPVYVYGEQLFEPPEQHSLTDAFSEARRVSHYWRHHGGGAVTLLRASLLKMQLQLAAPEQEVEEAFRGAERYLAHHEDLAPLEVEERRYRPRRRTQHQDWARMKEASEGTSCPHGPRAEGIGLGKSVRHPPNDLLVPYDPHRPHEGAIRLESPQDDTLQLDLLPQERSLDEEERIKAPYKSCPEESGTDREDPLPSPTILSHSSYERIQGEGGPASATVAVRHGSFAEEERNFTLAMLEEEAPVNDLCPDYQHIEQQDPFSRYT